MAHAGTSAGRFKPESIEYVIAIIQHVWSDQSEDKLQALFDYLKSNGVKSEDDVERINAEELTTVVGRAAARRILRQFSKLREQEKAEHHEKKKENTSSKGLQERLRDETSDGLPGYSDGEADPGRSTLRRRESRSDMTEMVKLFQEMQAAEGDKNRAMIKSIQEGMQSTMTEICGNIMSTVMVVNKSFTEQMEMQRQLLEKLGGEIVAMRKTHDKTARHTQELIASSQKMNQEVLMNITRKVNAALEANDNALFRCTDLLSEPDLKQQKGKCTVL